MQRRGVKMIIKSRQLLRCLVAHYLSTLVAGCGASIGGATAVGTDVALVCGIAHVLCAVDGHTSVAVELIRQIGTAALLTDVTADCGVTDAVPLSTVKTGVHCLH